MEKKIETIPFGGEIPPDLSDACNRLMAKMGWKKKRMLAAAIRGLVLSPQSTQEKLYLVTIYKAHHALKIFCKFL